MALRFLSRCILMTLFASAVVSGNAATFTVNSVGDQSDANAGNGVCDTGGGTCTLRAAIEEANANAGDDTIHFSIGSGARTITPACLLPDIAERVLIDGTTQPGYSGTPLIQIDGAVVPLAQNGNGFNIR